LGYVSRREHALADLRLFLPEDWAKAKKRRAKCRVPVELKFATKLELGRQMVQEHGATLPHAWVVGDDEFGRSTQFRRDLRTDGERYLLAIPSNTLVRDLAAEPPPYRGFGKRPQSSFVRVDVWCSALPTEAWTTIEVRDAEKGPLIVDVVSTPVLAITERTHADAAEVLVITRRKEGSALIYDYWLSNADPQTSAAEFARAAKARSRIEECIKRAKSESGLADSETRTWWGWHHHQTLSLLASWFLVCERLRGKKIDARHYVPSITTSSSTLALRRDRPARRTTSQPRDQNETRPQRNRSVLPLEITQTLTTLAN
jgi:SRSO17 transposase